MSWKSFHLRSDVLRSVIEAADSRLDGRLPMHVVGVSSTFRNELNLIGALSLTWHTRLAARIESELTAQANDPESAVIDAWRATAEELPGVLLILDRHRAEPLDDEMARALAISGDKEHALLAIAAGQASGADPVAVRTGQQIADRARHSEPERRCAPASLVDRLKAVLSAA